MLVQDGINVLVKVERKGSPGTGHLLSKTPKGQATHKDLHYKIKHFCAMHSRELFVASNSQECKSAFKVRIVRDYADPLVHDALSNVSNIDQYPL